MSGTIIDSLVVLFGLDPSGYKKGAAEVIKADKEVEAAQADLDAKRGRRVINTEKEEKRLTDAQAKREKVLEKQRKDAAGAVEKQSNDTIRAVGEVGRSLATMLLGFEGVTGFAKWMAELNQGEAQLGRTSLKIGMGVHELNKWGNATALAGGKAEDAQDAFGKLTSEFNTRAITGQTGPLLAFLRARGVAVADANGKLRNQGQILEELADKTAQYGAVYQANMFRQAGLNEGEIDYLIQAKALREQQLAIAEKNNNVTAEQVAEAKRLAAEWTNVRQEITAAGQSVLRDLSPNVLSILHGLGAIGDLLGKIPHMGEVAKGALNPFASIIDAVQEDYDRLAAPSKDADSTKEYKGGEIAEDDPHYYSKLWQQFKYGMGQAVPYASAAADSASRAVDPWQKRKLLATIGDTEAQLGLPSGLLARIAEQESHFRPDIIDGKTRSKAGAVGLMQLMPQYFPGAASMTPEQQIATAGKELVRLHKVFGDWSKAVAAYNDGEGNEKKILAGTKALPEETRRYIAAVAPTPGITAGGASTNNANSNTTTVSANIVVHANSADPAAVAEQTASALQRKIGAAQAFQGQS